MRPVIALILGLSLATAVQAAANPSRDAILSELAAGAGVAFSAERGAAFFAARHRGGKPDTPSCTTCHGASPREAGQTRAGKPIEPMAVSKSPARFTDPKKIAKWFRRNCKSVLGRECSAAEKGDFITFMLNQ